MSRGEIYSGLTQLGQKTTLPASPEDAVLERVANPHAGTPYAVRFTAPEFTSLCPMTSQPDFAHLVIDYVPGEWLVESKSLKLYLTSFRNHGAFHEECTVSIGTRLAALLEPEWLRIGGYWHPRGGIPIDVFYQTGPTPADLWIPDQGVPPTGGGGRRERTHNDSGGPRGSPISPHLHSADHLFGSFGTFVAPVRDLISLPLFRAKLASKAEPLPILHVPPRPLLRQHWTRQRRRDGQSRKQMWNLARSPAFSPAISPRRRQKW